MTPDGFLSSGTYVRFLAKPSTLRSGLNHANAGADESEKSEVLTNLVEWNANGVFGRSVPLSGIPSVSSKSSVFLGFKELLGLERCLAFGGILG